MVHAQTFLAECSTTDASESETVQNDVGEIDEPAEVIPGNDVGGAGVHVQIVPANEAQVVPANESSENENANDVGEGREAAEVIPGNGEGRR